MSDARRLETAPRAEHETHGVRRLEVSLAMTSMPALLAVAMHVFLLPKSMPMIDIVVVLVASAEGGGAFLVTEKTAGGPSRPGS